MISTPPQTTVTLCERLSASFVKLAPTAAWQRTTKGYAVHLPRISLMLQSESLLAVPAKCTSALILTVVCSSKSEMMYLSSRSMCSSIATNLLLAVSQFLSFAINLTTSIPFSQAQRCLHACLLSPHSFFTQLTYAPSQINEN